LDLACFSVKGRCWLGKSQILLHQFPHNSSVADVTGKLPTF